MMPWSSALAVLVSSSQPASDRAVSDITAPSPTQAIVGGTLVEPGEFNTVVGVLIGNRVCTGTLVSPTLIVTAAHCFGQRPAPEDITIAYGEEISQTRLVAVDTYGIHPEYTGDSQGQDIFDFAYVISQERFRISAGFITPLSSQAEWDETMVVGAGVTLVGYGEDPDDEVGPIGRKRKVDTDISRFTASGLEFFAGGDGRDSCNGDSGGPAFVRLQDGTLRLAGILSRGSAPCGSGGYYGVPYAAAAWIRDETGVDMLPAECADDKADGDCLDTSPQSSKSCSVGAHAPPLWCVVLLVAGLRRRRNQVTRPRHLPSAAVNDRP